MTKPPHDPYNSELVEEIDGQTVYLLGEDEVYRTTHAVDWCVRHPAKIRLMHDLVAIRPDPESGVTDGGIHIPDTVQDDQYNRGDFIKSSNQHHTGIVLAIGPGRREQKHGRRRKLDFDPGDRVFYHRASSTGIRWLDGRAVVLIHADGGDKGDALVGVVENDR